MKSSFEMNKEQKNSWNTSFQLDNDQINVSKSSQSNIQQWSPTSTHNDWSNDVDYTEENKTTQSNQRR